MNLCVVEKEINLASVQCCENRRVISTEMGNHVPVGVTEGLEAYEQQSC